ncbi:MAG: protein kinase [Proteobacteria bacterium]|jgi:eukaryotic-like serine/threonine-protein kinase|nr:protein kinase [Pseudomonadota bacterium]
MNEVASPLCDGRYRLVELLGSGGMGMVYRAFDSRLHTHRAIKLLCSEHADHPKVQKRFINEAQAMARLRHPNVVTVHDITSDNGKWFIVMELVEGGSLEERIKQRGTLSPTKATKTIAPVLDALHHAHQQGVIHRDIKPANILIDIDGTPRLTDFGIARLVDMGLTRMTKTGTAMGTLAYMPPEQRSNAKVVTPGSDIYSIGATLYFLVSGREPFDLYNSELREVLFEGIDPSLARVIQQATKYHTDARFESALQMKEALSAIVPQVREPVPLPVLTPLPAPPPTDDGSTLDFSTLEPHPTRGTNQARPISRKWLIIPAILASIFIAVGVAAALTVWAIMGSPTAETTEETPIISEPDSHPLPTPQTPANEAKSTVKSAPGPIKAEKRQELPPAATPKEVDAPPEPAVAAEPATVKPNEVASTEPLPGLLFVNSIPDGLSFTVNGRTEGTTPGRLEVALGEHTIVVTHPNGETSVSRRTEVKGSGTDEAGRLCWDFRMEVPCKR